MWSACRLDKDILFKESYGTGLRYCECAMYPLFSRSRKDLAKLTPEAKTCNAENRTKLYAHIKSDYGCETSSICVDGFRLIPRPT